jgi:hypothetical protein
MARLLATLLVWVVLGCSAPARTQVRGEPLYLAVEVYRGEQLVGRPKVLGEAGRKVVALRRADPSLPADYRLSLLPVPDGEGYRVEVDVELPDGAGHSLLWLEHGEQKRVVLGPGPSPLSLSLLVMKVDSPEFRALMELSQDGPGVGGAGAI